MKISKVFPVDRDLSIDSIMFDARKMHENAIFFAMKGKIRDGHDFIDQAIDHGAVCIVYSKDIEVSDKALFIKVDDTMDAYIMFCKAFYNDPTADMNVIGITGTNGKTTIAWLIKELISYDHSCGYIGTMGYSIGSNMYHSSLNLTTPKPDELYRIARQMSDEGCKTLVLEASSEGLLTHRLDHMNFSTAVFNNLTGDHFDIHGDMESYFQAKCLLFDKLNDDGVAIINIDDAYGRRLLDIVKRKTVTYGIDLEADYRAINIDINADHTDFDLLYHNHIYPVTTKITALFNVYNLLAVIAVMHENGYAIESFISRLNDIEPTPGRCQLIHAGQDFNVIVDFAFTPNSFIKVFDFADTITKENHKKIAVFGASGDRDHNRRPGTAKIADNRADIVILTYDDPSTEDMMEILFDLKSYFNKLDPEIILNREEAINKAIMMANPGDTVLLLGKGSDHFFLDKEGRVPYISDQTAAENAIKKKLQEE